jgi:beta-glucanase (GH16 family)
MRKGFLALLFINKIHSNVKSSQVKSSQVKSSLLMIMLWLCIIINAKAQHRLNLNEFELVWSDEFSYTGSHEDIIYQLLDAPNAKWYRGSGYTLPAYPNCLGGLINTNSPLYPTGSFQTECASIVDDNYINVVDGVLILTAENFPQTASPAGNITPGNYVPTKEGTITSTFDKDYPCQTPNPEEFYKGFNFGVFEIRAKLPMNPGDYAAFWLWQAEYQCGNFGEDEKCLSGHPSIEPCRNYIMIPDPVTGDIKVTSQNCGGHEVDIFEATQNGTDPNSLLNYRYFTSVQANWYLQPKCASCSIFNHWVRSLPNEDFHTYTCVWSPDSLHFFIDGNEIASLSEGSPQFKMSLILGLNKRLLGHSQNMEIDYCRVYRPRGVNYETHDVTTAIGSVVQATWDYYEDPQRAAYEAIFESKSCRSEENYGFSNSDVQLSDVSSLGLFPSLTKRVAFTDLIGNTHLFFHDYPTNQLKKMVYSPGIDYTNALYSGLPASTLVTVANDVEAATGSNLTINNSNGDIYYKSVTGTIIRRTMSGNTTILQFINNQGMYDLGSMSNLTYVPSNSFHQQRLYYFSNSLNRLIYYEYVEWQQKWERFVSPVSDVVEFVVATSPAGKIYYRNTNNSICAVWGYSGSFSNWQYGAIGVYDPSTNSTANVNVLGSIALHPTGEQSLIYRTSNHGIKKLTYSATAGAYLIESLPITDASGSIKWATLADGREQILYYARRNHLKTFYEREAPQIEQQNQWLSASLGVFSKEAQNPATQAVVYQDKRRFADDITISTALNPSFVFTSSNTGELTSVDMLAAPGVPIPNPNKYYINSYQARGVGELLNIYNDCSPYQSDVNHFDGLVAFDDENDFINSSSTVLTKIKCSPNPSSTSIDIVVENFIIDFEGKLFISDVFGTTIYNYRLDQEQTIDISSLESGVYFITTQQGNLTASTRFIKI